jgi:membrane associated rhomboid family serine protease
MFETLIMADSISNYATVSGFIVGLGVLLFVVRTRRLKESKTTISGREDDKGRKVKYGSDGKPVSG